MATNHASDPQRAPAQPASQLGRFNLATMSGVFPGTRTQTYQRLQLVRIDQPSSAVQPEQRAWLQLLWYDEPATCVGYLLTGTGEVPAVLFELADPQSADFLGRLQATLADHGWQLRSCGGCHFWQPLTSQQEDGLPLGVCRWQAAQGTLAVPPQLTYQSGLALACTQWQLATTSTIAHPTAAIPPLALRRAAESAEIRLSLWQRLWRRWRQRRGQPSKRTAAEWATQLVERSGVGAGTENCFVCQGRIANLGALTVASAENDKETYSVWRCRACYTFYLNDWVDRWERLDNLETEERYYRIAPAEALTLLMRMEEVQGGEHPNRRHERQAQRQFFTEFMANHLVLSHQIRQGR